MTATEQVRADLALRMSSFPLIESAPHCEVTVTDATKNLLTLRQFVVAPRRFAEMPVQPSAWGVLS